MVSIGTDDPAKEDEKEEEAETAQDKEGHSAAELKEQLLRLAAEFDNYKKRVRKDIDGAENMGKASLVKGLLPVIDEFELAMLAIGDSKDKSIARGVEMLYSNFMGALRKEGLKEVDTEGVFDPYRHEIVMVREDDEEDGVILEVVKNGYMFGDRLIRPASVIVSKNRRTSKDGNKEEKNENNA